MTQRTMPPMTPPIMAPIWCEVEDDDTLIEEIGVGELITGCGSHADSTVAVRMRNVPCETFKNVYVPLGA